MFQSNSGWTSDRVNGRKKTIALPQKTLQNTILQGRHFRRFTSNFEVVVGAFKQLSTVLVFQEEDSIIRYTLMRGVNRICKVLPSKIVVLVSVWVALPENHLLLPKTIYSVHFKCDSLFDLT